MTQNPTAFARIDELPFHRFLPWLYRILLTVSRKHGLFTLARFHRRLFGGEQRVAIPHGESLIIPDDSHYFGFLAGVHEPHVAQIIRRSIRPGDFCVDVGANIGYFSMMMANAAGPGGRVLSFEPVPSTFETLRLNAALAERQGLHIVARQVAVSAEAGELVIERREHSTLNQVREIGDGTTDSGDRVPCLTLADCFSEAANNDRVSLLKVDVEGHELAVVRGALPVLQSGQIERMIIEITPGADAARIENLLATCKPSVECWIDGRWQSAKIKDLVFRTDVLVSFGAGVNYGPSNRTPTTPVTPEDPFQFKRFHKANPIRLLFTARARLQEFIARRKFASFSLPVVVPDLNIVPVTSYCETDTAVTPAQMRVLQKSVLATEALRGVAIEIGAYRGVTTAILAGQTSRSYFAVDPYMGYGGAEFDLGLMKQRVALLQNVRHLRMTSGEARGRHELWRDGASFIFVDAVHDYMNARFDGHVWGDLLNSGGLIAFHDTDSKGFAGVQRAVWELLNQPFSPYKLFAHVDGLAVLQKKSSPAVSGPDSI